MTTPIRLRAEDEEDLKIVSACLQDAILPIGDMCYLPEERRFVAVLNRFKWESADGPRRPIEGPTADDDDLYAYERVHCGVRFENVMSVKTRGLDLRDRRQMLELLSVVPTDGGVLLQFSGGGCVRLCADRWQCTLEDLGEPWPTTCKPCHPLTEE